MKLLRSRRSDSNTHKVKPARVLLTFMRLLGASIKRHFERLRASVTNCWRNAIVFIALSIASTAVLQAQPLVANFDFEQVRISDTADWLPGWHTIGSPDGVLLDSVKPFAGKHSISIASTDPSRPSGIWQAVTTPLPKGYYRLSAQLSAEALSSGVAGIWLRYQLPNEPRPVFVSSYAERLTVNGQWSTRNVYVAIPENAHRLAVGANVIGIGQVRVDNFELNKIPLDKKREASKVVVEFLDDAIDKIRNHALNAERIKWDEITAVAYAITGATDRVEDAYPAISLVLHSLGDRHSHLIPRSASASNLTATTSGSGALPPMSSKRVGNHLYLEAPAFVGSDASLMKAYTASLSSNLSVVSEATTCGLILDLRRNTGGNMWPAFHALRPTFDTQEPGYFVFRDGTRKAWSSYVTDDVQGTTHITASHWAKAPIALLIGPRTTSSGEALMIAYLGRANMRSFGAATAGLSTGNTPYLLKDGSTIAVTTTNLADRSGKLYGMQIEPDEKTEMNVLASGEDSTLQAAAKWLDLQSSLCPQLSKPPN